jgi:hypothetical protein
MHQKKVFFGILGVIAIAAFYYFMPHVIQVNKNLAEINRQLAEMEANGFTLSKREIGKEKEHFWIRLDDPEKASTYFTRRGIKITSEAARELRGLQLTAEMTYLNDTLTLDLYPVSLPDGLHALLTQEKDQYLLTQIEEILKNKTLFVHIDLDHSDSTFQGTIKDINVTLQGRQEVHLVLQGFRFSGDIKKEKIVKLTQTLQTLHLFIEGMLERTLSGIEHDYRVTGPTVHDYQEAYHIRKVAINEAPEAELLVDGIFMRTTSTLNNGLVSETLKTKIKKMDLLLEKKPLGLQNFSLEMHISNIDIGMLDALGQKILSPPLHIDIPILSVEKIRQEGKEIDGFALESQIEIERPFDISRFATDPTQVLSVMDAHIALSLSNDLLALLKEDPETLLFYMRYRPKIISDQSIYNIHLKDGSMKINGKALKIHGEPVRF